jgi:hypothetical protein
MDAGNNVQGIRNDFGNLHCFIFIRNRPLICIGPHCNLKAGPFFICLSTSLALLSIFFVLYMCPNVSIAFSFVGMLIYGFLIVSYLLAALSNPGIEMRKGRDDELEQEEQENYCSICDVYRHPRSQHCEDCGVCIQEYDHHCPWTSKCIGKGNALYFYCFLTGLLAGFVFGIITMALQPKLNVSPDIEKS